MKYTLKQGQNTPFEVYQPRSGLRWTLSEMRTVIVLSAGALIAVFLIGAAIYGVVIGDFSTLGDLWDGLKELLLFIAGFYFGKTKPHRK